MFWVEEEGMQSALPLYSLLYSFQAQNEAKFMLQLLTVTAADLKDKLLILPAKMSLLRIVENCNLGQVSSAKNHRLV